MGSFDEFRTRAHGRMNWGRLHLTRFRSRIAGLARVETTLSLPQGGGEGPSGEGFMESSLFVTDLLTGHEPVITPLLLILLLLLLSSGGARARLRARARTGRFMGRR